MRRVAALPCAILLCAIAAGCASSSSGVYTDPAHTAGCTAANCTTLLNTCDLVLHDDGDADWCVNNTPAADLDGGAALVLASCPRVCEASGEGVLLECIATDQSQCTDEGSGDIGNTCATEDLNTKPERPSGKCDALCQVTRAQCDGQCPLTDFGSCFQCTVQCGLKAVQCRANCPLEPSTCWDNQKDGDETDVDCGGTCSPCSAGQMCQTDTDCTPATCSGGTCANLTSCRVVGDCPDNACLLEICE